MNHSTPGDGEFLRAPPHSYEAERALLGAILCGNRAMQRVPHYLAAAHFADPVHGRVFEACLKLQRESVEPNLTAVTSMAARDPLVAEAGGASFMASLAASMVTTANTAHYAKTVYDLHRRRLMIELSTELTERAHALGMDETVDDLLDDIDQKFTNIAAGKTSSRGLRPLKVIRQETLKEWDEQSKSDGPIGFMTGLQDLDRVVRGIGDTDFVLVAGRPAMGKTALAMTIARNKGRTLRAALKTSAVALFSLEMNDRQLDGRLLTMDTGVASPRVQRLTATDCARLIDADPELPLWIDDTGAMTLSHIRRECLRLQRRAGLACVIVDYLQLLRAETGLRIDNRVQLVGHFSRGLKGLAKELKVPVIALAQLNRAVEQREDKRPQLADLRDSGEIEQDADIVMFCYRHEYYLEREEPKRSPKQNDSQFSEARIKWEAAMAQARGRAEVIVAKHRHDRTGTAHLAFDAERTMFDDLGPPPGHPAAFDGERR